MALFPSSSIPKEINVKSLVSITLFQHTKTCTDRICFAFSLKQKLNHTMHVLPWNLLLSLINVSKTFSTYISCSVAPLVSDTDSLSVASFSVQDQGPGRIGV